MEIPIISGLLMLIFFLLKVFVAAAECYGIRVPHPTVVAMIKLIRTKLYDTC